MRYGKVGAAAVALVLGGLALAPSGTTASVSRGGVEPSAIATQAADDNARVGTELRARLNSMNNSGAVGSAEVTVRHRRLNVDVDVRRVLADMPHAMHIHFGKRARHECPTVAHDDHNGDFRIETVEGAAAYGPVRVSFTTRGPTGKGSVLAVKRFPTAPHGEIHYDRHMRTGSRVAAGIRARDAVVVVHGLDYNGNGKYDFRGGGRSDLNPDLPAEATDPAACGVLR
jgi:hypothetical protein